MVDLQFHKQVILSLDVYYCIRGGIYLARRTVNVE